VSDVNTKNTFAHAESNTNINIKIKIN